MVGFALLLALLTSPPEAAAPSEVLHRGARQAFSSDHLGGLASRIGDLASGAGYAAKAPDVDRPPDLVVVVHYSPPLQLTLHTPTPRAFHADQISLYSDEDLDDGWPLLVASSGDTSWSLAKYDGGLALDLLCSDQLEPLASHTVRSNCQLAPSRRTGRSGSPDP